MSAGPMPLKISEAAFQQRILDYCALRGLLVFHDNDSRRNNAGFPDLVIAGRRGVIFAELKTDTGRLRPEQETWLERLAATGQNTHVWRPADWHAVVGYLEEIR